MQLVVQHSTASRHMRHKLALTSFPTQRAVGQLCSNRSLPIQLEVGRVWAATLLLQAACPAQHTMAGVPCRSRSPSAQGSTLIT